MLYGLEACPLVKSELSFLDFVVNKFFMKMFRTNNIEIVRNCQSYLGLNLPSDLWPNHVKRFDVKLLNMPPQGAVLLNMVSLSLSFDAFLVLIVIVFFLFLLSVFLMNKDVYI